VECFDPRRVLASFHWRGCKAPSMWLCWKSLWWRSRRALRTGNGDHLGPVAVPWHFQPPWGRAVKTGSTSTVTCSFLAWISLAVSVMVAEGLGDSGYRCACFRSRLCLSLHVNSTSRRPCHSDVFRWCLELVMYFLSLPCGGGSSCLYQPLFYLNTKRVRHDLKKKLLAHTDSVS
jgi:hypothetical protein